MNIENLKGEVVFLRTKTGKFLTINVEATTEDTIMGTEKYGEFVVVSLNDIAHLNISGSQPQKDGK